MLTPEQPPEKSRCRYCEAAWPRLDEYPCDHTDWHAEIARALARLINGQPPTDEQIGWFIEDAEVVAVYIKEPCELTVAKLRRSGHYDPRIQINGLTFGVDPNGEGEQALQYLGPKREDAK